MYNNDNDFKQQFTHDVRSQAATQPTETTNKSPKALFAISIILASALLLESIAMVIIVNNYSSTTSTTEDEEYVQEVPSDFDPDSYSYDSDYNLIAVKATCTSDDGSYTLDTSNNYMYVSDKSSAENVSGTYTITNDSLISLSDSGKILYYNGASLADGLTVYRCE